MLAFGPSHFQHLICCLCSIYATFGFKCHDKSLHSVLIHFFFFCSCPNFFGTKLQIHSPYSITSPPCFFCCRRGAFLCLKGTVTLMGNIYSEPSYRKSTISLLHGVACHLLAVYTKTSQKYPTRLQDNELQTKFLIKDQCLKDFWFKSSV